MIIKFTRVTMYVEPFTLEFKSEPGEDIHDVVERNIDDIEIEAEFRSMVNEVEDYEQA